MRIENNFETVKRGKYAVITQLNGGTSFKLQISIDGGNFVDIDNASFTSDATNVIDVPDCRIQGVSVGGAFSDVNLIEGGFY
jgi:hypothetical protein